MPNTRRAPQPNERYIPEWSFADRLRKIRIDCGYEQREFAALLEMKSPTYSAYESGRAAPRYKDLNTFAERVEEITGVPVYWLLDVNISPVPPLAGKKKAPTPEGMGAEESEFRPRDYSVGISNVTKLRPKTWLAPSDKAAVILPINRKPVSA